MKKYLAMLVGAISTAAGAIFSACVACAPVCSSGGCCAVPGQSVVGPLVGVFGAGVSLFLHTYGPIFVVLGVAVLATGAYLTVKDRASKREAVRRHNAMNETKGCCGGGGSSNTDDTIKDYVKEKYGEIAATVKDRKKASCCGGGGTDPITRDLYSQVDAVGLPDEALLASLGCGNPVALAELNPGEVVLDLGSGGGIDVILSARRVGPTGKAYGLDMTDEMLDLARRNQKAAGVENVEFLKGDIERIPLPDRSVDVIISNCVINLSMDKDRVLREAFRVLKPGGRLAVADIVLTRPVSEAAQRSLALWAGCIAGALSVEEYRSKLADAGFKRIDIEIVRTYEDAEGLLPDEFRRELGDEGIAILSGSIASAFIRAVKPAE